LKVAMATDYIGLIRKDRRSDYSVEFPDFPGCVSAGATLDEARRLGAEALDLHIEGMLADDEELPTPSGLEAVMRDPANAEAVAFLVSIDVPTRAAVRVNVTFAARVLEAIDARARKEDTTRSALLAEAALDRIRGARFTVIRWGEGRARSEIRLPEHLRPEAVRDWMRSCSLRVRVLVEHHRGDWSAQELGRPEDSFAVDPAAPRGFSVAEPAASYRVARKGPARKRRKSRPRRR
jgi:predicted RNase H-like HicB family nuclease